MKYNPLLLLLALAAPSMSTADKYMLDNISPRFQWSVNQGYCGEVSFISAGLKYGQYVSQYKVRELISSSQVSGQLLLGVNDELAATRLRLNFVQWNGQDTAQFLQWIKAYILNGYPVIIGVYMNTCLFDKECQLPERQGDTEYDHIVPILGIESADITPRPPLPPASLPAYYGDDKLIFSDNGAQGPVDEPLSPPCQPNPANPYLFSYTFKDIQADRARANQSTRWYSLSKATPTYGIAILGVKETGNTKVTIPVSVTTNQSARCPVSSSGATFLNYEFPSISNQSETQPISMPLELTVTVTVPDKTKEYKLYRFDDLSTIPTENFNQLGMLYAKKTWTIPPNAKSNTFVIKETIDSNEVAAYRSVPSTAP
jgi:hypothetical protein